MAKNNLNVQQSVGKGLKSTAIGMAASLFLVFIKGAAGIIGNSYALIADAIESSADIVTSFAVLIGLRIASKPADYNHPYGHGKAEPIAGVIVSLALFAAAAIIIVRSIHGIIVPHAAPASFTLIVLVLVILIKESLFRYVIKVGNLVESVAVKNDAWHHRSDAITSTAAFIGISIALIGGKGYEQADGWAALFASGIIIINAFILLLPALREIMDTSPSDEIILDFKSTAQEVPGVKKIDKCLVRKMGVSYFVDIHVVVDGSISVHDGHLIGHKVKDKLISTHQNIMDVLVHIEPDYFVELPSGKKV